MDNIVVPFTYDGKMAMNYGWIVRHGKFDFVKTKGKEAKADSYQLQANFPVRSVEEALDGAGDVRKEGMLEFMRVLDVIDRKAREWILADTDGSLFGVPFTAADLDPKVRLDGKIEKGKFNSTLKAGAMPNGDPMLLKAYLKVPSDPTEFKVYADLHLNGSRLDSTVANFLEHVKWNNDVGILFSVKDMIKSSQGISVRIRVGDCLDRASMRTVFEQHRPNLVLHAAAYKHVPLMESHPVEAVQNTSFAPALKLTRALLFEDASTASRVRPVVPLNVPTPISHSLVPTMA
jgi:hypothetical protein